MAKTGGKKSPKAEDKKKKRAGTPVPETETEGTKSAEGGTGTAPSTGAAAEAAGLSSEIEGLREQVAELTDKWLRAVADLDNFRKRTARERERELGMWMLGNGFAED